MSSKEFCGYIVDCLSVAGDVSARNMMGGYCVYFRGKLIGLICDNCLYIKRCPTSESLLKDCETGYPYEGSKQLMFIMDELENPELVTELLEGMFLELPEKLKK